MTRDAERAELLRQLVRALDAADEWCLRTERDVEQRTSPDKAGMAVIRDENCQAARTLYDQVDDALRLAYAIHDRERS